MISRVPVVSRRATRVLAVAAFASAANAAAQEPEQIPLIGADGPELDACVGIGSITTLDPDLPVRGRPDEYAREKDRLPPATLVWLCEKGGGENGEGWQGIVYPSGEYQELGDCRVSSPVAAPEPYAGPCRSGWVAARNIRMVAG